MKIFLARIMQGSKVELALHDQSYREALRDVLQARFPQAHVFCPLELNPDSVDYDLDESRECFFAMTAEAASSDLLIAYLPAASMGTAVEMYAAYQAGVPIVSISPLAENWVVKLLSSAVLPSLAAFATFVQEDHLEQILDS